MPKKLVVLSGMSGSGKTLALHVFEDLDFYSIDNLPPELMPRVAELCSEDSTGSRGVAMVIDARSGEMLGKFESTYEALRQNPARGFDKPLILFLDASNEVLLQRFKETRRHHPLVTPARGIFDSIKYERQLLSPLKALADRVIDTTKMEAVELRTSIQKHFDPDLLTSSLIITVVSFGFKHGIPLDADLVFDVRFLSNPHYIPELRPYDGTAPAVRGHVLSDPRTEPLLERLFGLVEFSIPQYVREGKAYLTIAIGCTGGRHRSVVVATELARFLSEHNYGVVVEHRDVATGPL